MVITGRADQAQTLCFADSCLATALQPALATCCSDNAVLSSSKSLRGVHSYALSQHGLSTARSLSLAQCAYREKKINDAVRFAQETLSPLRGIMSHRSTDYDAMLHDTVALIAYEEPEVSNAYSACS